MLCLAASAMLCPKFGVPVARISESRTAFITTACLFMALRICSPSKKELISPTSCNQTGEEGARGSTLTCVVKVIMVLVLH